MHEFTHAFGYPHKCGYYGWPQPPEFSCAMNYFLTWLYDVGDKEAAAVRDRYLQRAPVLEAPVRCSRGQPRGQPGHLELDMTDRPTELTLRIQASHHVPRGVLRCSSR